MITITDFDDSMMSEWDDFVSVSPVSTFLHTRKFLSYHGKKFNDRSLCVRDDKNRILSVFNAAEAPDNNKCIVSHPGATYGGLVVGGKCRGGICIETLKGISEYYVKAGYKKLVYKAVPCIYHQSPLQDDIYALFRLNAMRMQSELSACIDLSNRGVISNRRKRALKKAVALGINVERGSAYVEPLWALLIDNLQRKHKASPVHTLDEIKMLYKMFHENIDFVVATLDGEVISGVVLFYSSNVTHAQYIASSEKGYKSSGLDAVFSHCIDESIEKGKRYFDFGTSNENNGKYLNSGLYEFKSEFGAGGVVYEHYELQLDKI